MKTMARPNVSAQMTIRSQARALIHLTEADFDASETTPEVKETVPRMKLDAA
jgi:hypothetical protein